MKAARAVLGRISGPVIVVLLAVALTASASGYWHYRVRPGDTLSALATRYHTTVAALVRLNDLPGSGNLIYAGSVLRMPPRQQSSGRDHARLHSGRQHHSGARTVLRPYIVRPGDALYLIADRFHVHWGRIARINHLSRSLTVFIGQRLLIPHHIYVSAQRGLDPFRGVYVPSRTQVVGMLRATAQRWRVNTSLALAVSYEEAGFNQRRISPVGAIGAMQVMPATGTWISAFLHRPLNLYRARDNVAAGVALLAILLRETNGHVRTAVAGYYQGLTSVRKRGMYADTKRYVANVLALRNQF